MTYNVYILKLYLSHYVSLVIEFSTFDKGGRIIMSHPIGGRRNTTNIVRYTNEPSPSVYNGRIPKLYGQNCQIPICSGHFLNFQESGKHHV